MRQRAYIIASLLVMALTAVLFNLSPASAVRLKAAAGSLFRPLFAFRRGVQTAGDTVVDRAVPRQVLLRELAQLQHTNQLLRMQVHRLGHVQRENQNLRAQLKLPGQHSWNLKFARVIGRDPAQWWRTLQIDCGERDGLKPNMPVLTEHGLVGRVQTVSPRHAQVALIGDPACRVSVLVESTRENGILMAGPSTLHDPLLVHLNHLPAGTAAKPGDRIITSGLGSIFRKGIPIGTILEVQNAHGQLQTTAQIKLANNPARLENVWVIIP